MQFWSLRYNDNLLTLPSLYGRKPNLTYCLVLQRTITTPGVWRIRRLGNSPTIEVFRIENIGHGKILSPDFVRWREELVGDLDPNEALARKLSRELDQELEEMELEKQKASLLAKLAAVGGGGG